MGSIGVPVRAFFVESRKPFIAKKEYNEKNIRIVSIQFRFHCYTEICERNSDLMRLIIDRMRRRKK